MLLSLLRSGQFNFENVLLEVLVVLFIVFLVLPFHEWAHAFTAFKLGDTSVKARGRLTLNPLEHIDPFGALALLFFGFGWAKPVPIDPRSFKNPKWGMALTALMGPVANIVAALVGALVLAALVTFATPFLMTTFGGYLAFFLQLYITVNCNLAVFNLLPIPPLDGSKILFAFLPDSAVAFFYRYQMVISIALIALLWIGVLSYPISLLSGLLQNGVSYLASLPFLPFS